MGFEESEDFNDVFSISGFEGSNFIEGTSSVFVYIVVLLLLAAIYSSFIWLTKQINCCLCVVKRLPAISYNIFVTRFLMESYLELGINGAINTLAISDGISLGSFQNGISSIIGVLFVLILILFPIATFILAK